MISDAFENARAQARKHSKNLPDLTKQGHNVVPRRSRFRADGAERASKITIPGLNFEEEQRRPWLRKGIPTGKDGRALPRSYNVKSFSSLVGREVRKRDWTENMAYGWVMGNWEGLVGAKIAEHTKVEMIKDGEVFITCNTTAWATQLKYMQSTVLRSIAEKVGPDVIRKLHIYGPKTKSWRYGPLHVKGRGPRDTYG